MRQVQDSGPVERHDAGAEMFRTIFHVIPSGIVAFDRSGTISFANPELERLLECAPGSLAGSAIEPLFKPPLDMDAVRMRGRSLLDHALRTDAAQLAAAIELRAVTSTGTERSVEIRLAAAPDGQFVACVLDISERRQRERELRQRMRTLEQSNSDLEQFASIASHDLREPLRMVVSYTQLLSERYRGQIDEKADKFINYAVQGATRMQRLIDDLLCYSKLENPGRPSLPTAVADALRDTLSDMRVVIADSGATISYGQLPTVLVDPVQLTQLFQNLIHNAIKFRSEAPPNIEVSAQPEGGMWRISIRDNGIGIDKRYHDRIFQMFQRLHERSKYDGSGIGLATARKIVERHGGTISVTSAPGEGSTFTFTLPAAPTGPITL